MQTPHIQGNRWSNRDHMLTWLGNKLTQGNMLHPWNISIIFTKPNPCWLSTVAGLDCQGGSALLLSPVPPQCWWTQWGAKASAALRLPLPLAHQWGAGCGAPGRTLDPLSSCSPLRLPKKAAGKSLWLQCNFLLDTNSCRLAATSMISFQRDFRHLDTSINSAETLQKVAKIHVPPRAQVSFTQLKKQLFLVPKESP